MLTFAIIGLLGNIFLIPEFGKIDFSQENLNIRLKELASTKINAAKIEIPEISPPLLFIAMLVQGDHRGILLFDRKFVSDYSCTE